MCFRYRPAWMDRGQKIWTKNSEADITLSFNINVIHLLALCLSVCARLGLFVERYLLTLYINIYNINAYHKTHKILMKNSFFNALILSSRFLDILISIF